MTGLNTAAIYILQTLGSLYLLIVLLRFILQLVRADFYNPLSQFVVRATQPLVRPLRRLIPGLAGLPGLADPGHHRATAADGTDPAADGLWRRHSGTGRAVADLVDHWRHLAVH